MAPALKLKLSIFAAAMALLTASAAGWIAQGWRKDAALQALRSQHANTLQAIADKTTAAQSAVRKYEQATAKTLAQLDHQKTQEIENARLETDRLRRCIAAGTCGVRINTTPGAAGGNRPTDASTARLDAAAPALDAALQQRVLDLRDAIALDAAALEYLQGYALQCQNTGESSIARTTH